MPAASLTQILLAGRRATDDYVFERWGLVIYGLLAGLALLISGIAPARSLLGGRSRLAQLALLAGLAGPAALIIPMATPLPGWGGPAALAAGLWLLVPLAIFRFRSAETRLTVACALPALAILVDGLSEGHLFRDALWGRMPIAGGRLYGIDNTCMGVLIGAGWIALGCLVDRWPGQAGRITAAVLALGTAIVLGLPMFGANVGGSITAAVGATFFTVRLFRARAGLLASLLATAAAAAIVGLSLAVDSLLPTSTHLLGAWTEVVRLGPRVAWDIVYRKLAQNGSITLPLLAPGILAFGALTLRIRSNRPAFIRRFQAMPGLDAALSSLLPALLVGYLVNDTGAVTDVFMAYYYFSALVFIRLDALSLVSTGDAQDVRMDETCVDGRHDDPDDSL
jgi:hypothetical protein